MTFNEMEMVLNRIRINRSKFDKDMGLTYKSDGIKKEWFRTLKDYDYQDVDSALTNWLKDENNKNFLPNVYELIKGCYTLEEKNNPRKFKCACMCCGVYLPPNELKKHEDRCRSVSYLKRIYPKYMNRTIDDEVTEELMNMSEHSFNNTYYLILEKIYDLMPDCYDKELLENVLKTKNERKNDTLV